MRRSAEMLSTEDRDANPISDTREVCALEAGQTTSIDESVTIKLLCRSRASGWHAETPMGQLRTAAR